MNEMIPKEIAEKIANEYVSKIEVCDECCWVYRCTIEQMRKTREPYKGCHKNIVCFLLDDYEGERI